MIHRFIVKETEQVFIFLSTVGHSGLICGYNEFGDVSYFRNDEIKFIINSELLSCFE